MNYSEMAVKAIEKGKVRPLSTAIFTFTENGQRLIGKVMETRPFKGGSFDTACLEYLIETDEGLVTTILGSGTDKALEKVDLRGKVVIITFHGKKSLKDGRSCNQFTIDDISSAA